MKALIDNPLFSSECCDITARVTGSLDTLFIGPCREDRTHAWDSLRKSCPENFIELSDTAEPTVARITSTTSGSGIALNASIQLRNPGMVNELVRSASKGKIYIDITSLPTHIWAPLVRACWETDVEFYALYVEPGDYTQSPNPTAGGLFDLSERIAGISPIPGFASIRRIVDDEALFVPLLGFEGARLAFVTESVEPKYENIFPIVGVPGFRAAYPFHTYLGNQSTLNETGSWKNVRYSRANCPFSAFYCLESIASGRPGMFLKIAPIGTKPHGLGAILFYLTNPDKVEIVYDHPLKLDTRTNGASEICLYDISSFRDYILTGRTEQQKSG